MMEALLKEQQSLLERLKLITDQVANAAYRQNHDFSIDADLEAFEVQVALHNVQNRLTRLQRNQPRRQRQR